MIVTLFWNRSWDRHFDVVSRSATLIDSLVAWSRSAAPKCRPADVTYSRSRSPSGTLGASRAAIDDVAISRRPHRGSGTVIEVGDSCFDNCASINGFGNCRC